MIENKIIQSPLDIDKFIRNVLSTQSELALNYVLNGISLNGQDLRKVVANSDNKIWDSFTHTDTFIVFEKEKDDNSRNNMSETRIKSNSEKIDKIVSYKIKVYIYGDNSDLIRNKLVSRLLSQVVKVSLLDKGIHIIKIDNENTINEFVNNIMWIRNDFDLYVSVNYEFSPVTNDYEPRIIGNKFIETI